MIYAESFCESFLWRTEFMLCHQLVGYKVKLDVLRQTVLLCPGLYSLAPELKLHLGLPCSDPAVKLFC